MLKHILIILPLLLAHGMRAQTATPAVQSSASQPLIILIGPPLSGKTTLVDSITRTSEFRTSRSKTSSTTMRRNSSAYEAKECRWPKCATTRP